MQLTGSHIFDAPRAVVWEALMDPTVLAKALPGGDRIERVSQTEYRAGMNVRIGPVQGKFQGKIELEDVNEPESYVMKVNGQGAPGFVNGAGELNLVEVGEQTRLDYVGDLEIGGRIAGVSQRIIDSTAKSLTRQGLEALDRQIRLRMEPEAPAAAMEAKNGQAPFSTEADTTIRPSAPTGAPSTAGMAITVARDVAKDLADEYIPAQQQEKLLYAALGALGMLLFVVLVRLVQRD
ncbi:MAG: carbon monoxide dehydrogenase subunit G [Caldilineaceae bacterium]|nr:carbon monoxide dehydrogenase subunit G [Caldilineaceae bacterium]